MSSLNVRILFLHDSDNEVQETLNLLRNAGINAHGERIDTQEAFEAALSQAWSLIVFSLSLDTFDRVETLRHVQRHRSTLPVIVLDTETGLERITEGLQAGAADVVLAAEEDEDRLLLVLQRELSRIAARAQTDDLRARLAEAEKRCELLLGTSAAAIAYVHDGMHVYVNANYLDLFGHDDPDDLAGIPFLDLVDESRKDELRELFRSDADRREATFLGRNARNQQVQGQIVLTNAEYEGEPCIQVLIRPPQIQTQGDSQIQRIQTTDPLTGLLNRQFFMSELERGCAVLADAGQSGALLFVCLDNLTRLRGEAGIVTTDAAIADVAAMLSGKLGGDSGLARFTDDAFALFVRNTTRGKITEFANDLRQSIEDHLIASDSQTLRVTASIAVAMVTEGDYAPTTALARAHETATQFLAEGARGNEVRFYEADARPVETESTAGDPNAPKVSQRLIDEVRDALTNNRFKLFFQPIISLRGDDEEIYEVFVRLPTESGKLMRPMEFLPSAEKVGIAGKVDRWIVLQSIKTLSSHRSKGHPTRLIINLTYNSLADKTFLPWLTVAIKAARLPSDAVIFQISEDDANTYLKQAREFTRGLAELHCRASLSHFGKTVNPFGVLRHLNVDLVKLDGTLVENLEKDPKYRETLGNTISSLQGLGKLTVVPMVETATLLASLWQAGANYIQGHYLQEPTTEMDYDFGADDNA